LAFSDPGTDFLAWFSGKSVDGVSRRGKYIVISIPPKSLIIHLRMSGDIRVETDDAGTLQKHDRFLLRFADGLRMVFNDTRKFGRIWLTATPETLFAALGIEPLSEAFNAEWLRTNLGARKTAIKALLLNQSFIAGLGNIYTDEILFQAGILPTRKAFTLRSDEIERLPEIIKSVLQTGIKNNGASIDWVYRGGNFQNHFQVYQRAGAPCYRCGTPIVKDVVGQRGTHYCPYCQH